MNKLKITTLVLLITGMTFLRGEETKQPTEVKQVEQSYGYYP